MTPEILPIVAVIGSGADNHEELSRPLGKWLAENGYNLINGGGGGVMEETARAFAKVNNRKGKVIGVLPSQAPCESQKQRNEYKSPPGYPNAFTEIIIKTHLPSSGSRGKEVSSRNHIIILSADIVIALPGGTGTRSEIELALDYKKRLILFSPTGGWKEFEQLTESANNLQTIIQKLVQP